MKYWIFACALAAGGGNAMAATDCPPYTKRTPGGDYTSAEDRKDLSVVEQYHY